MFTVVCHYLKSVCSLCTSGLTRSRCGRLGDTALYTGASILRESERGGREERKGGGGELGFVDETENLLLTF